MKKYILTTLLLIGLLISSDALAQKERGRQESKKPSPEMIKRMQQARQQQERSHKAAPGRPNPEMLERMQAKHMEAQAQELEIEMRHRSMDLEEREMDLQARRKKMDMEMEKHWLELEAYKAKIKQSFSKPDGKPSYGKSCPPKGKTGCDKKKCCPVFFGLCLLVHILLTTWVFQDIRKRNAGSGLWIVITLVAGFFGALLYLLARIGDNKE